MSRHERERPLEFSDIASGLHAEILKDPYGFLGLPQDADFAQVRAIYIAKAKLYHPDMIAPSLDSDASFRERYSTLDFKTIWDTMHEMPGDVVDMEDDKKWETIGKALRSKAGISEEEARNHRLALEGLRVLAHKKMVEINTAYEAIKLRTNPKVRDSLAGYKVEDVVNEGITHQEIKLEGHGKIVIFPDSGDGWMPGPYLAFDWAPDRDHRWMEDTTDFQEYVFIKHLFVHHELQEEREQINRVLLEPFFRQFGIDPSREEDFLCYLTEAYREGYDAENVMWKFGVPETRELHMKGIGEFSPEWYHSVRFQDHVNEMIALDSMGYPYFSSSSARNPNVSMQVKDGRMMLKGQTESVLSEADVILLETIAYGPMLRNGES